MKVSTLLCTVAAAAAVTPSSAFLQLINKVNPALTKYTEAQEEVDIKIRLNIVGSNGNVEMSNGKVQMSGNRLGVDGLHLQLMGNKDATGTKKHVNLPGASGPNSHLSSGPKAMNIIQQGQYVDLTGTKYVNLQKGVWEIVWRNNAKAGTLTCGFNLDEEVKRNDVVVPKGRVYLMFPVWTTESLQHLRERKAVAEEKAVEALDRMERENRMMQETNNLLMKAIHFRNACKAHEDLDYSGYRSYQKMPLEREMIHLEDGLHLSTQGTVWTQKDGFFGFGGENALLGVAHASKVETSRDELVEVYMDHVNQVDSFDGLAP